MCLIICHLSVNLTPYGNSKNYLTMIILGMQTKNSLQTKKSWQGKFFAKKTMQRKQRKIWGNLP